MSKFDAWWTWKCPNCGHTRIEHNRPGSTLAHGNTKCGHAETGLTWDGVYATILCSCPGFPI